MNKTININLGGYFFHIDESAYKILKRYLASISNSLQDDEEAKKEIIGDIEARMSELLSEKMNDNKEIINDEDIKQIINIMGQPEDFVETEEINSENTSSNNKTYTKSRKLYRDGHNRFLGGVSSGIAHLFNLDPIIIRILFLIITLTGGFGILVYILLWILVPKATTTSEKLEMEGEAVNIENIGKRIRDEFDEIDYNKTKSSLQNFLNTIGQIIRIFFSIISKTIGIIIKAIVALILLSILTVFIGRYQIPGFNYLTNAFNYFSENSVFPSWLFSLFVFIALAIPFFLLVLLGLRILFSHIKKLNHSISLVLFGVWIISVIGLAYTAAEFSAKRAHFGHHSVSNTLPITSVDTLRIKMINDDSLNYKEGNFWRNNNTEIIKVNGEERTYSNHIYLKINKSNNSETHINIKRKIKSANTEMANSESKTIEYEYTVTDNHLDLDAYFLSTRENMYKEETVIVTLFIPKGNYIYLDKNTKSFLSKIPNKRRFKSWKYTHKYLKMTPEGLKNQNWEKVH